VFSCHKIYKLITKLLYGTAFRAPSFQELYSQNNPIVLGNEALETETIKTTELAFNYELMDNISSNINFYHYKTKDMIEFIANSNGTNTAQNAKDLTGNGIELDANWDINKQWNMSSSYAYQSTKDNETHQ
jgi:iron complex outermembrane receptor protein